MVWGVWDDSGVYLNLAFHLLKEFFLTAAIFRFFFWKDWNFEIIPLILTILGKSIRSRRHLPHLSKIKYLFLKKMSKFGENNHFWFVLIFYSQVQKKWFLRFLLWSLSIFSTEKCLRSIFSLLISIIWAF